MTTPTDSPPPPRALVFPLALSVGVGFGAILYGFSVLLTTEAAGGVFSRTLLSGVFSGAILTGAAVAIPIGRHADRHGIRGVLALGGLLVAAGFVLFAASTRPWHLVVAWLALIGPGSAMVLFDPAFVALEQWFDREQRNRAAGTLTLLTGLAGPIFVPAVTVGVRGIGWRPTTVTLGLLVAATTWFAAGWALRHAPRPKPLMHDRMPHLPRGGLPAGFLAITGAIVFGMAALEAMNVHRIARFEATGFDPGTLAVWAAISSLASLPARFLLPRLANRLPGDRLLFVATLALAPAVALAIRGQTTGEMVGHFVVFGILFGAVIPLRTVVMGDWYGGPTFGVLMGLQAAILALGRASGPAVVGWLGDGPGGYPAGMALLTGLLVAAAGCVAIARRQVLAARRVTDGSEA